MGFKITRELNENEILSTYGVNSVDDTTSENITYVGMEDSYGVWLVKKLDETSGFTITYATEINNSTIDNLSDAWDNRATTLVYCDYNEVF